MLQFPKLVQEFQAKGWKLTNQLPFSRTHAYSLIGRGILKTILIKAPDSKIGTRLVEPESLAAYIKTLVVKDSAVQMQEVEA